MLEELKRRINSDKADLFLADAVATVEAYTGRKMDGSAPSPLRIACIRLAVVYYNREGIEGESGRTEGGVTRQMEAIPSEVVMLLKPYRMARVIS